MIERRQQPRTSIRFPVYFICAGEGDDITAQGIAMALDINAKGILIESEIPINARAIKITASLKNKTSVEMNGDIAYSMQMSEGKYRTGIFFSEPSESITRLVDEIISISNAIDE